MPQIIQFLHTAVEATPENINKNIIPWNNHSDHKRKFLFSKGKYVSNDIEKEADLVFWGEWEAQSEIENLPTKTPKYLNYPFLNPTVLKRTHNTDPYVFGDNFRYLVCKQHSFKILKNLESYSLILFGSCIKNQFCLDTLFVVGKNGFDYSIKNIEECFTSKNQYYHASVNPLYDETNCNPNVLEEDSCRIIQKDKYRFYKGVNFTEKNEFNNLFSFVPSKIKSKEASKFTFRQPLIELDIISPQQTQGINGNQGQNFSISEITDYWKKIRKQVEKQDLILGTNFQTPKIRV